MWNSLLEEGLEPDVVHAHFGPKGISVTQLKKAGVLKCPLVTTFYGYDISRYVADRGRNIYEPLFQNGDFFLALSEEMKK